jgi:hypothetical protein
MMIDLIRQQAKIRKTTEAVLKRACRKLPPAPPAVLVEFEAAVANFHRCLSRHRLKSAFEELYVAAALSNCRGGVWRDLERAAEFMNLYRRLQ